MSEENKQGGNLAGFNTGEAKKAAADVLPVGEYDLVVASCKLKPTTKGDYQQIAIELKVLNGEFQNRTTFQNLSFSWTGKGEPGESAKTALRIGRGTFAKICDACGIAAPNDTADLVGRTFRAKLRVKQDDEFGDKNILAKCFPRTAGGSPAAGAPAGAGGW